MPGERTKRMIKRAVVIAGILAAIAGLLVLTRPGVSKPGPAADKLPAMLPEPVVDPPPPGPVSVVRSTTSQAPAAVAPSSGRPVEHGPDAVVRAQGHLETASRSPLALHDPVWDDPARLTFMLLKINYFYFKRHAAFSPDSLPPHHGGAVTLSGAVMPIDPPGPRGELPRFWLCNPSVVMAGCVFCNPPTLADLVYIHVPNGHLKVDREQLYRSVVLLAVTGRFFLGPEKTDDGIEYLYRMEFHSAEE